MDSQALANQLEEGLLDFGVRIIKTSSALRGQAGRHLANQLLRCGTSPAANYAEARSAESRTDFQHKLKIVLKELNESRLWLRMISRSEMIKGERLGSLIDECEQLSRIINASITTSRTRQRNTHNS